jgi:ketosteroid isomerase-like protein
MIQKRARFRIDLWSAKVLPPDGPIGSGRPAIEEFLALRRQRAGPARSDAEERRSEVSGDTACEVGEAKLKLAAGQTVAVKYLVVWMKGSDGH